jgi:hypothetical protein
LDGDKNRILRTRYIFKGFEMNIKVGDKVRQVIDEPNTYILGDEAVVVDIIETKDPTEDRYLPGYLVEYRLWDTGELVRHLWPYWWKLELVE